MKDKLFVSLLKWYDRSRRLLPWRALPGVAPSLYYVWLSEIMLQQTTVQMVKDYFHRFIQRWPTLCDLASANEDEVLAIWQGLGYYSRARNLLKCAQVVVHEYKGEFPSQVESLRRLPGIGPYTAAAIASIGYDKRATVVDGNIKRIISRLFCLNQPLKKADKDIYHLAEQLTPLERCGDYAQALMDLGALICTPTKPKCLECPIRAYCRAYQENCVSSYPVTEPKKEKPKRWALAFVMQTVGEEIYIQKRVQKGLLHNLFEVPTSPWKDEPWSLEEGLTSQPISTDWQKQEVKVTHTFSHFHLEVEIFTTYLNDIPSHALPGPWVKIENLSQYALPTIMKKIISAGL